MWVGWDRCGYDTFDDQPLDPENNMAWQPPPSGREERAHLLGPVGLPTEVVERSCHLPQQHRHHRHQQQQPSSHHEHLRINQHPEDFEAEVPSQSGGAGGQQLLSGSPVFLQGGRRHCGSGGGGGGGGVISSFFRGTARARNFVRTNTSANGGSRGGSSSNSSNNNKRARFLSDDSSNINSRRCHYNNARQHVFNASPASPATSLREGREDGTRVKPSSLWKTWRSDRRSGSFDGQLTRNVSNEFGDPGGSFGLAGGGGGRARGSAGPTNGKIPEMVRVAFFDPDYDTSRQHLVKLFNTLDTNGSGTITYEAMRLGLANLGTYSDVNYLMRRAEMDKSKEISLDGFVEIVQDYAEKMFAAKQEVPVRCFCYDYSPEEVSFRWVETGKSKPPSPSVSLRELMAERDDQQGHVRWVCVTGCDPSLVIHLANRFGIHPLQVEDCLNPRERFKVDAFRGASAKPSKTRASSTRSHVPAPAAGAKTAAAAAATAAGEGRSSTDAPSPAAIFATNGPIPVERVASEERGQEEEPSKKTKEEEGAAAATAATMTSTPASLPVEGTTTTTRKRTEDHCCAGVKSRSKGCDSESQDDDDGDESVEPVSGPGSACRGGVTGGNRSTRGGRGDVAGSSLPPAAAPSAAPSAASAAAAAAVTIPPSALVSPVAATPAAVPTVRSLSPTPAEEILHVVLGRISLRTPTMGRPSNFEREQVSVFLVGDHTVLFIEPSASGVSDQISNRIYYAGSKLRLNNARYLVYSLMDSIVDDVFPIMQHFQAWLVQLQEQLHSEEAGPSLDIVRAIQQISRDMHMMTFYLRPMKVVATQLITDLPRNDADLKRHLEDLRDHLLMLEEQALRMSTWSRSLNKDWVNEQQHRMNQVVYILTMVTSAFMPAQFLTGVFGMNFKFMPELNWRYSYASFWVLVALLAFSSYTVYKRHKWL